MNTNLKLSFILLAISSSVTIAWRTLYNFFSGTGINLLTIFVCITLLITIMFTDKSTFNRIKEMFIITCVFAVLELIVYFAFEFVVDNYNHIEGFLVYQNVLSILGLLYFAYIAFRFITEYKNVKISFVEFILGNSKQGKKIKKVIEIENGTLEEKPNKKESILNHQTNTETFSQAEESEINDEE